MSTSFPKELDLGNVRAAQIERLRAESALRPSSTGLNRRLPVAVAIALRTVLRGKALAMIKPRRKRRRISSASSVELQTVRSSTPANASGTAETTARLEPGRPRTRRPVRQSARRGRAVARARGVCATPRTDDGSRARPRGCRRCRRGSGLPRRAGASGFRPRRRASAPRPDRCASPSRRAQPPPES
jgi:hypothetical protein